MTQITVSNLRPDSDSANAAITIDSSSWLYSPGAPVQTHFMRTDNRDIWSVPVVPTFSLIGAAPVWPLSLTIRPRRADSLIYMAWQITCEVHYNVNWVIWLNGQACSVPGWEGYNPQPENPGRWVGYVPVPYEASADINSTLNHMKIDFLCKPNSTDALTFTPAVIGSGSGAYTLYLNRTAGAVGQDNYENGVSTGMIQEIAQ